jgi:hypothetical protein
MYIIKMFGYEKVEETVFGAKWHTDEEAAFKRINCSNAVELRNIRKYFHKTYVNERKYQQCAILNKEEGADLQSEREYCSLS